MINAKEANHLVNTKKEAEMEYFNTQWWPSMEEEFDKQIREAALAGKTVIVLSFTKPEEIESRNDFETLLINQFTSLNYEIIKSNYTVLDHGVLTVAW